MNTLASPAILIPQTEISAAVARLASGINRDYLDKNPVLTGVLKGSFMFMADLVRQLDFPLEIEFARFSSYANGCESSGKIKVIQRLSCPLRGRHVLVVEDIIDTGLTTTFFLDYLARKKPASLRVCALLDKPSRRRVPVQIDYLGFTVPNKFVVGYGIDWNQQYRNLPDICTIEEGEE